MFRLLRYVPVALPIVLKFLRSPKGKAAINKARQLRQKNTNDRYRTRP